jgi:hypothetical protein
MRVASAPAGERQTIFEAPLAHLHATSSRRAAITLTCQDEEASSGARWIADQTQPEQRMPTGQR